MRLFGLTVEKGELFLRQQELAHPLGVVAFRSIDGLKGGNAGIDQIRLTTADEDMPAIEFDPARPDGFYLSAKQYQSGLKGFEDFKVKMGFFVSGVGAHILVASL